MVERFFLATLPGISTSKPLLDDISDFREAGRCYVSWAHLRLALFPLAPFGSFESSDYGILDVMQSQDVVSVVVLGHSVA